MKRAVLMARVSSDEQAKGYSLDMQMNDLITFCEKNSIIVVKSFREDHSAKTFNRPGFQDFLDFSKQNKGSIDCLLFTTYDRFSRNATEALNMIARLHRSGIEAVAIKQILDFSIPENKVLLNIYLTLPECDNDRRSMKVKEGLRGALKSGRWIGVAPKGYKNSRDDSNKPILTQNEQASTIKELFETASEGISQVELRKSFAYKGLRLSKSNISVLLRNPVYMGKVIVPAFENELSYLVKGIHEPIISEDLFYKVQDILIGKIKKRNRPSMISSRDELPLRGLLLCSKCEKPLTGSPSRSKTGRKYFYYHCNYCRQIRYRADEANETMKHLLNGITPPEEVVNLYFEMLKDELKCKTIETQNQLKTCNEKILKLEERIRNLQDHLADKKIEPGEYSNLKSRYDSEIRNLKEEILSYNDNSRDLESLIERAVNKIKRLSILYDEVSPEKKKKLLSSIFPEKLYYENKKYRTQRINLAIQLFLNIHAGSKRKETGHVFDYLDMSCLVPGAGIEPARPEVIGF